MSIAKFDTSPLFWILCDGGGATWRITHQHFRMDTARDFIPCHLAVPSYPIIDYSQQLATVSAFWDKILDLLRW